MPLNVFAKEWQPAGALAEQLMTIRVGGASSERSAARAAARDGVPGASPASSSGGDADGAGDEELQFEEIFDRCASAEGSAQSTPRASVSSSCFPKGYTYTSILLMGSSCVPPNAILAPLQPNL